MGEQVLSYNEELGIFTNKNVAEKYVNETEELVHIHTAKEEIVCTPKHSILTDKGWKQAKDITEADSIQSTADSVQVQSVEIEQLPEPIKVYNLNVLDYHTYVIGEQQIIVHNMCKTANSSKTVDSVDDALDLAEKHLGPNQSYYKGNKNILVSNSDPRKID